MLETLILTSAILLIAILYSSVGHAGASGYIAAMALVTTMPQEEMKAVALTLNIFVGSIGAFRFVRAGHFDWATFWPFGLVAIPFSFLGGLWTLPDAVFKPLIGAVLLFAAILLIARAVKSRRGPSASTMARAEGATRPPASARPALPLAIGIGAALGLLAGLTGTGGGIFLSPLLMLFGWAEPKRTAAVCVVFVLLNSVAGLAGRFADVAALPADLPYYIVAAVVGGLIGSGIGASRKTSGELIRGLLGLVLVIAAVKMFLTAVDQPTQQPPPRASSPSATTSS